MSNQMTLQMLVKVFWGIFVILFNRVMLKMIIFSECQSTESQEGGGEQGV